ncbi:hypothetical protein Tco_1555040 [Tanacetum coccineum]
MHNDIMAAGSRERPPMLAPGHYAQWSSQFMRYVDTKSNKNELRNCIEKGPYIINEIVYEEVLAIEEQPVQPRRVEQEMYANTTQEKRRLIDVEVEAIHIILNGIGDDIYSTMDACSTPREMWLAIERLQQGEFINKQDVKTTLFWEFGKLTSRDGESIELYYSIFYKMMNDMVRIKLKVDTMQQHQNEVNEICDEKIDRNANPLALVVAAQQYPDKYSSDTYYQASKPHKTHTSSLRHTTPTSSHATTRNKSKEIAKPITTLSKSAFEEENSGPTYDAKPLEKVHLDDHYNVFATNRHHSKQPESINDTCMVETVDSNVILGSSGMCDNEGQADQNTKNPGDERVFLASLIANFKLDLDENKKSQRNLKKANMPITQELNKSQQDLEKTKQDLEKSKQVLEKTKQDLEISKQNLTYFKSDLEKYKIFQMNQKDKAKTELECARALGIGKSSFANPLYLKQAQNEKPCLYNVKYDKSDLANLFAPEPDETIHLAKESRSKLCKTMVQLYD